MLKIPRPIFYVAIVVVLALIPVFVQNPYYLTILITAFMFSVPALGVRLVVSTGEWNFGQGAFMTIGAYTSGILAVEMGWTTWATMPSGLLMAAVVALVIGHPALRTKGVSFAIVTIMLGLALRQVILMTPDTTGGNIGIHDVPGLSPILGLELSSLSLVPFYFVAMILLIFTFVVMYRLEHSRVGLAFKAIRQGDAVAEAVGVNIRGYKLLAFVISSALTGLAGALSAHYYLLLYITLFGLWQSVFFVLYALVGGVGVVIGPVIGTFAVVGAVGLLTELQEYQGVALGAVLLVVIMILPGGIVSLPEVVRGWVVAFRDPEQAVAVSMVRGWVARLRAAQNRR